MLYFIQLNDRWSVRHREALMPDDATLTWLPPSEAGRRLGESAQRIRQLGDAGHLRHCVTPLGRLIDPEDVARLRAEREPPAPDPRPAA
jgi:hypothetical protein